MEQKSNEEKSKDIFEEIAVFFASFCGLSPLVEMKFSHLFCDIFKPKNQEQKKMLWGGIGHLTQSDQSVWPRPWAWARIGLGLIFIALIACVILVKNPDNLNALPGALFLGAFAVPITCLVLIYELDASKEVALYDISKGVLAGGIASIGLALNLFSITGLHETFLGATSAGVIEEIAKVAIAIVLFGRFSIAPKTSHGLIFGAAVGAGFAGFETAGYMLNNLIYDGGIQFQFFRDGFLDTGRFDIVGFKYDGMLNVMFQRGFLSPFCHVVWSSIAVAAAWHSVRNRGYVTLGVFLDKNFIKPLLLVISLHMLWNSGLLFSLPKNLGIFKFWIWIWAFSFYGSWCLMLLYAQEGIRVTISRNSKSINFDSCAIAEVIPEPESNGLVNAASENISSPLNDIKISNQVTIKGCILDVFFQKSSGVILGSDDKRYTFEFNEWREKEFPLKGQKVDFRNEGLSALDVCIDLHSLACLTGTKESRNSIAKSANPIKAPTVIVESIKTDSVLGVTSMSQLPWYRKSDMLLLLGLAQLLTAGFFPSILIVAWIVSKGAVYYKTFPGGAIKTWGGLMKGLVYFGSALYILIFMLFVLGKMVK